MTTEQKIIRAKVGLLEYAKSSCRARLYCAQFNDCLGQGERHV